MELVISRYKESIDWLEAYKSVPITIYDKSGEAVPNSLPNIGREAHTYLHHIVTRYDTLADLTVFLQGSPFDHVPDLFEKIWSLTNRIQFQDLCDNTLCETATGDPGQPGIPIGGMYERLFGTEPPLWFLSQAAACFAVSRTVIHSRSRSDYERYLKIVVEEEMGPWTIERLWRQIFVIQPASRGIVTAADSSEFSELQLLLQSIRVRSCWPVAVCDFGLSSSERHWLQGQPLMTLLDVPKLLPPLKGLTQQTVRHWWLKPFLLFRSPFDRPLWIDPGCTVLGDLSQAFAIIEQQPLFCRDTRSCDWPQYNRQWNPGRLFPVSEDSEFSVNTGVVGVCRQRDYRLLAAWGWIVETMIQLQDENSIRTEDDHWALRWAILQCDLKKYLQPDFTWNAPVESDSELLRKSILAGNSVTKQIQQMYPLASIVRWPRNERLAQRLSDEFSRMFAGPLGAE